MTIALLREHSTPDGTLGRLSVNGLFLCYSLEPDEDRAAHPAIPAGTYQLGVRLSPKFGHVVPIVLDVPGRSLIEVHPGNRDIDTDGCILLGMSRDGETLGQSRAACALFQHTIAGPIARGEDVTLTIQEPKEAA